MLQLDWMVLATQSLDIASIFLICHLVFAISPYLNVYTARRELVSGVARAAYFF